MLLTAKTSLFAPLALELPKKLRPESDWLYSTGGKPHEPATDPLAAEVVSLWRPSQTVKPEPMRPGWAGLASYRLPYPNAPLHLKIAMGEPSEKADAYNKLCQNTVGEAARATWAGNLGLGPKVLHVDAARGAFISSFAAGRAPSFDESQNTLLPLHVQALASIHKQDASTVPSGGHVNWLLEDWINVASQLAANKQPRPAPLQHALIQLEKGLLFYIDRNAEFKAVPIHNDYKPDNTIYDGSRMVVLDWNNLIVSNPAIDLGHFACMVDLSSKKLEDGLVKSYANQMQDSGASFENTAQLANSTQAYTSLFRIRNAAFYDQWEGTRPKADYLRHQLIDDVAAMDSSILTEVGLKSDLK